MCLASFDLTGIAGGAWQVGSGEVISSVQMNVLDFNIYASGRLSLEETLRCAEISGVAPLAKTALKDLLILY